MERVSPEYSCLTHIIIAIATHHQRSRLIAAYEMHKETALGVTSPAYAATKLSTTRGSVRYVCSPADCRAHQLPSQLTLTFNLPSLAVCSAPERIPMLLRVAAATLDRLNPDTRCAAPCVLQTTPKRHIGLLMMVHHRRRKPQGSGESQTSAEHSQSAGPHQRTRRLCRLLHSQPSAPLLVQ